jgi:hypothetical protein
MGGNTALALPRGFVLNKQVRAVSAVGATALKHKSKKTGEES